MKHYLCRSNKGTVMTMINERDPEKVKRLNQYGCWTPERSIAFLLQIIKDNMI